MKIPAWAPDDLVQRREEIRPKAEDEARRAAEFKSLARPERASEFYVGPYYLGHVEQLEVIDALLASPPMELVWKSLHRRAKTYKAERFGEQFLYGGHPQSLNLLGACLGAKLRWMNNPKLTRTQYRELYTRIANSALELADSLLTVATSDPSLLNTRSYLPEDYFKEIAHGLELDDVPFYLEHAIGERLPAVPGILLELHKQATERAKLPRSIPQPNSPDAELHYFIRALADYFKQAYGQPLNANVAAITAAVFGTAVDEDKVRALLRADKDRTRRKIEEMRREIDG